MLVLKRYILLIPLYIASMSLLFAQIDLSKHIQPRFTPFEYNGESGTNRVVKIIQDRRGFIWFGSDMGLTKYDGSSITQYINNDDNDSLNIKSGYVIDVLANPDSTIWFSTLYGGLSKYDPFKDDFKHLVNDPSNPKSIPSNDVRAIFRDSQNRLWVGTVSAGLCLLNEKNNSFKQIANSDSVSTENIYSIEENMDGELLLDTGIPGSIVSFNPGTETFSEIKYSKEGVSRFFADGSKTILIDSDGDTWIGTLGSGLYRLTNGQVLHYQKDLLGSEIISDLIQDHNGFIWVATDGGGIALFDKPSNEFTLFKHDEKDTKSINSNSVLYLYEGSDGLIWVSTASRGLNIYNNNPVEFKHISHNPYDVNSLSSNGIRRIAEDNKGDIWIGTEGGGLNRMNNDLSFTNFNHDTENYNSIAGDMVVDVSVDYQGDIWLGTYGTGFSIYSPTKHRFQNYMDGKGDLPKSSVWSILHDNENNTWLGTLEQGIYFFDKKNNEFIKCNNGGEDSLVNKGVSELFQDSNQTVWVGFFNNGFAQLNREEKLIKPYLFKDKKLSRLNSVTVRSFYEDTQGRLWAGCQGTGLVLINGKDGTKIYNESMGLSSNNVMGILEDDHGNLWISTNGGGLCRFNPETEVFRCFDDEDGLQSNNFSKKAHLKTSNGLMLFGGINGLNIFHPDSIRLDTEFPEVIFTGFKVFDEEASIGSVMDKHINLAKTINLDHSQTVFSIQFSALKFTDQSNVKFSYFLEGFDETWRLASMEKKATYTNLEPGTYTFKVKATNVIDRWGSKEYQLVINIIPPWWNTLWFKGLLVILFVLIIIFFDKYRHASDRKRKGNLKLLIAERTIELKNSYKIVYNQNVKIQQLNESLEEKVKSRTFELTRKNRELEQFVYIASHDLQEPLRTVTSFTDLLSTDYERKLDDDGKQLLKFIKDATTRMRSLIKGLLDYGTIGQNKELTNVDLNKVVQETLADLDTKIQETHSEIIVNPLPTIRVYEIYIRQLFQNLLSNAIKFRKKDSRNTITISSKKEHDGWLFAIQDLGIGIDKNQKEKIFLIFQRLNNKEDYEGTGIGLAHCKKIVELHDGKIWVESQINEGSTFYFKIAKK